MKKLNLGAGNVIKEGYTNHDIVALEGIDCVHDLNEFPWPWEDNTFDVVISTEVFEHLEYPFITANEVYRVLKKDGIFIGSAPFLFPIHGDPDDHFRFTNSSLKLFFKKFRVVKIFRRVFRCLWLALRAIFKVF